MCQIHYRKEHDEHPEGDWAGPLEVTGMDGRVYISKAGVPMGEGWRVQYLAKLLQARKEMETKCQDVEEINLLIESLCSS